MGWTRTKLAVLFGGMALVACSSGRSAPDGGDASADAGRDAADSGASDTGPGDGGAADTGAADTGAGDGGGPPADYVEGASDDNDGYLGGTPEATSLTLDPGGALTIDGRITDHEANEVWVDSDMFAFSVSATTRSSAELDFAADSGNWSVALLAPDLSFVAWWGVSSTGRALTAPVELPPGQYIVHVARAAPAAAMSSSSYRIRLDAGARTTCTEASTADFSELAEAAGSRDNDVAAVRWAGFPTATAVSGAAQATGLTVEPGAVIAIEGVSEAVAPDGDEYFDRDAFELTAGATTTELHVRVDHAPANVDLDLFLFARDDPTSIVAVGGAFGFGPDELVAPVTPGARYLVWVGSRVRLPAERVDYKVTACGR